MAPAAFAALWAFTPLVVGFIRALLAGSFVFRLRGRRSILRFRRRRFAAHFRIAFSHGRLSGEAHPAFFIHAEALDPNLVAELDDVLGFLDAEIGEFADVNETVLAGQEFYKRAEFLDRVTTLPGKPCRSPLRRSFQ
jgi:hypothetical protein